MGAYLGKYIVNNNSKLEDTVVMKLIAETIEAGEKHKVQGEANRYFCLFDVGGVKHCLSSRANKKSMVFFFYRYGESHNNLLHDMIESRA